MINADRIRKKRRVGLAVMAAVCLIALFRAGDITKSGSAEAAPSEKKEVVIETVEDIPAMDIEEQEVPLAAGPDSQARSGVRHAVLMGVFLAGALGYAGYFMRYDRKLYRLRKEAADLEYQKMIRRREEKGQGEDAHDR